ncbi:hypothetical protein DL766_003579 [Monosporascus sp. MC13-8B]|uniref:Uncharacterized protein n=1 Tax=Monosporascus cannonballus TaxID=155416 RepID=A0ABY0GQY5_9PEZI|nr:hypothetical protein DL762_009958 [Monosporascus cannonballus]RYO91818.1 hypothetical protein DL763_004871 [Monosporascus cannonballus]RYP33199.1 hypothetical protein DL766_003579 [Monosporascus sp. MC13-8B]
MSALLGVLCELERVPEDQVPSPAPYYRNWGFTIYRTEYSGSSDQKWQVLLDKIQTQLVEELKEEGGDDDNDRQMRGKLISLFQLDARSDAGLLQHASMDQVRQLCQGNQGGSPLNVDLPTHRYFLLADAEVLKDVGRGEFWVKCVQPGYVAADYVPKNTWLGGGQRYFGWMKMTARNVFDLWRELDIHDLESIAPQTIGGMHLVTWDGQFT